jgi:hypothetical protein
MRLLISLAIVVFFCASNAYCQDKYDAGADCKSECKDTYDMTVSDCQTEYDGPYDTNERQKCIDEARDEYESCIKKCEGLDDAEHL